VVLYCTQPSCLCTQLVSVKLSVHATIPKNAPVRNVSHTALATLLHMGRYMPAAALQLVELRNKVWVTGQREVGVFLFGAAYPRAEGRWVQ
jgi:hypothetical protein